MSILESMVSTQKRYISDNFPILQNANLRGENLYHLRLYAERAAFQSQESGLLRMQVLLGFIEARSAVIDAVIKSEGTLHYLSVICSSMATPHDFSQIVKRTIPRAIIEQMDKKSAEECISSRAVRDEVWNVIPHANSIRTVNESRRILLALLLEYRSLLAEYNTVIPAHQNLRRTYSSPDFSIPFLIFEQNGSICGIPEFQIEHISPGGNGSHILQLHHSYGHRMIIANDLLCMKEIDIVTCAFLDKIRKGYYHVSTTVTGGKFDFTLLVPSFL